MKNGRLYIGAFKPVAERGPQSLTFTKLVRLLFGVCPLGRLSHQALA